MEIFELLFGLFEACGCFAELFASIGWTSDAVIFHKGRPNREARREAREAGETPPPLEKWFWGFLVMTIFSVVLTIFLIARYTRQG